jgi:hypothetical protein
MGISMNPTTEIPDDMRPTVSPPAESNSASVPGGVYLCQVDENVSCGACCGLYNCPDASRAGLQERLTFRTEHFREVPRETDAIDAFREQMERRESRPRPYPDFYHCPFLGFGGRQNSRVGCLLHPLADGNQGVDLRGLSFYGGLACRDYFCPSHRNLPPAYKAIVTSVCTDWYVYGLAVTEERLLAGYFWDIERRLGRRLEPADIAGRPGARQAVVEFLGLKLVWPFHGPDWKGPANYFFNDGLYPRSAIDYERLGARPSQHDVLLRELSSAFSSRTELTAAETRIEDLVVRIVRQVDPSASHAAY